MVPNGASRRGNAERSPVQNHRTKITPVRSRAHWTVKFLDPLFGVNFVTFFAIAPGSRP